jgi:hypothetical protein
MTDKIRESFCLADNETITLSKQELKIFASQIGTAVIKKAETDLQELDKIYIESLKSLKQKLHDQEATNSQACRKYTEDMNNLLFEKDQSEARLTADIERLKGEKEAFKQEYLNLQFNKSKYEDKLISEFNNMALEFDTVVAGKDKCIAVLKAEISEREKRLEAFKREDREEQDLLIQFNMLKENERKLIKRVNELEAIVKNSEGDGGRKIQQGLKPQTVTNWVKEDLRLQELTAKEHILEEIRKLINTPPLLISNNYNNCDVKKSNHLSDNSFVQYYAKSSINHGISDNNHTDFENKLTPKHSKPNNLKVSSSLAESRYNVKMDYNETDSTVPANIKNNINAENKIIFDSTESIKKHENHFVNSIEDFSLNIKDHSIFGFHSLKKEDCNTKTNNEEENEKHEHCEAFELNVKTEELKSTVKIEEIEQEALKDSNMERKASCNGEIINMESGKLPTDFFNNVRKGSEANAVKEHKQRTLTNTSVDNDNLANDNSKVKKKELSLNTVEDKHMESKDNVNKDIVKVTQATVDPNKLEMLRVTFNQNTTESHGTFNQDRIELPHGTLNQNIVEVQQVTLNTMVDQNIIETQQVAVNQIAIAEKRMIVEPKAIEAYEYLIVKPKNDLANFPTIAKEYLTYYENKEKGKFACFGLIFLITQDKFERLVITLYKNNEIQIEVSKPINISNMIYFEAQLTQYNKTLKLEGQINENISLYVIPDNFNKDTKSQLVINDACNKVLSHLQSETKESVKLAIAIFRFRCDDMKVDPEVKKKQQFIPKNIEEVLKLMKQAL